MYVVATFRLAFGELQEMWELSQCCACADLVENGCWRNLDSQALSLATVCGDVFCDLRLLQCWDLWYWDWMVGYERLRCRWIREPVACVSSFWVSPSNRLARVLLVASYWWSLKLYDFFQFSEPESESLVALPPPA